MLLIYCWYRHPLRHLRQYDVMFHSIEGNHHTLPTSGTFQRESRLPDRIIRSRDSRWRYSGTRACPMDCSSFSFCRMEANRWSPPIGPTSKILLRRKALSSSARWMTSCVFAV